MRSPRADWRRPVIVLLAAAATAGCGAQVVPGSPSSSGAAAQATAPLAPGPVTVIALGDSLTAVEGDDAGKGFVGRLTEAIGTRPGREGSDAVSEVTAEEVGKMSLLAKTLARTAGEVAAAHGVRTVDTNDAFWADATTMADDGIHPNAAGYTALGTRGTDGVAALL